MGHFEVILGERDSGAQPLLLQPPSDVIGNLPKKELALLGHLLRQSNETSVATVGDTSLLCLWE